MIANQTRKQVCAKRLEDARGGEAQESLAARAGISTQTISRIERGKHLPSHQTAAALSRATGRSVAYFLGDDPEEEATRVAEAARRMLADLLRPLEREMVA